MAETGYWDNKGATATKVTWDNPEIVPVEKRNTGGWYYNPDSGYVDRWWSGTQGGNSQVSTTDFSAMPESSDQLPNYLADFQKTAMESLSSLKPVEVPTFEELKNNLTPDTPAPTPISRVAERERLRTSLGLTELESELNDIKTEETRITDELRALTGTEEGKPVAMNVISGRITEEERVAQQRLDAVLRQKNSIINELNTKYNIINTYVQDLGLDYQDAVQAYNTEFERNYKVQSMITDMSSQAFDQQVGLIKTGFDITMDTAKFEQTIRQANIDNARANLTTMMNAVSSGNLSYGTMSNDQKLQIQKLEIQSGLPVGTMSNMGLSPKDKVLAFSSDNSQAWVIGQDGKMKVISTGLTPKSDGTVTERTAAEKNNVINKVKAAAAHGATLNELISMYAGTSGVTSTEVYKAYNSSSSWGVAKESPEDLAKLGVKTINNTSTPAGY
jgi:hypothetical protein